MFNWFKSKIELKRNTDIMCSVHNKNGLKLGNEIIVPNNFKCLVFHKGKLYNTLDEGKYKMDKKTFNDLIQYQQRHKFKTKHIKCVCHYINISKQKLEIRFKKQQFMVEYTINDVVKFTNLALLYTYTVDNEYILSTLNDVFRELLIHLKGDHKLVTNTALEDYGILIDSFAPKGGKSSIFNNSSISSNNTASSDTPKENNDLEKLSEEKSIEDSSNSQSSQTPSQSTPQQPKIYTCPKCNNTVKFDTTYCLRCGYKLK